MIWHIADLMPQGHLQMGTRLLKTAHHSGSTSLMRDAGRRIPDSGYSLKATKGQPMVAAMEGPDAEAAGACVANSRPRLLPQSSPQPRRFAFETFPIQPLRGQQHKHDIKQPFGRRDAPAASDVMHQVGSHFKFQPAVWDHL